jgi:hypothetical protein
MVHTPLLPHHRGGAETIRREQNDAGAPHIVSAGYSYWQRSPPSACDHQP